MTVEVPALRKETDDLAALLDELLAWARDHDDNITFVGPTAPAAGADFEMEVQVQDVNNILERFTLAGQVTVDITGGTATAKQLLSDADATRITAVDGSLLIPIVEGVGSFFVRSSAVAAETVILGLTDSGSTGLTVTDTHTATYA